jgi:MFS family permease
VNRARPLLDAPGRRPAVQAIVADLVPADDRPRAFGLLIWAINIGFSVAMVLGGTLAGAGFHLLFWVDALACLAFGLLVWRAVPETRAVAEEHERGGFAGVLRDRAMLGFMAIVLAAAFVFLQCLSTLPLAMWGNGLPPSAYGIVMAVNGVVIVLAQPLLGHRLGRWDHSRVLAAGIVLFGLGFGATALAAGTVGYAVTVVVWTFGEIVFHSVAATVVNNLAPAHLRGRYNGAYGTAWGIAAFVAPLGGTLLLSVGAPVLWSTCLVVCLLAAAGQLALAPAIRRRRIAGEA